MVDLRFNVPMFARGDFPPTIQNNSQTIALQNPWINRGNSAPFDQRAYTLLLFTQPILTFTSLAAFFLIMNVAVGGTNGWFPDNSGDKPWVDGSTSMPPLPLRYRRNVLILSCCSRDARLCACAGQVVPDVVGERRGPRDGHVRVSFPSGSSRSFLSEC
jgi:hypothetical protein